MPSILVPYAIPKDKKAAFITCVYLSSDQYDYKSVPLRQLEKYLCDTYNKILVISDENGYVDNGVISREENYCTLHLMSKSLL